MTLMSNLLAHARRLSVKHGNAIYYAMAIAAYNVWALFPEAVQTQVFCTSIAITMAFVCLYFVIERAALIDRIFLALAINNVVEEIGFGDPTKFTLNEYVTTVIVVLIVISNYTKPSTDVAER